MTGARHSGYYRCTGLYLRILRLRWYVVRMLVKRLELSHGKVQLQDNTMPRTNLTRGARISRLPENIGRQPPDEDMNYQR